MLALGGVGILLYVVLWIMLEDEPADLGGPFGPADAGVDAGEPMSDNEAIAVETDEAEERKPGPGDVNAG